VLTLGMIAEQDKKYNRGDVRKSDCKLFWSYLRYKIADGSIRKKDYWVTKDHYDDLNKRAAKSRSKPESREYQRKYSKEWEKRNKEHIKSRKAAHRKKPEVRERLREYFREYRRRPENKEKIIFWRNKHKRDPESMKKKINRDIAYYSNPEVRERIAQKRRIRENSKRRTDPEFLIKHRTSCRIRKALRRVNAYKSTRTVDLIGCSYSFLKEHIEKQFKDGMAWNKLNSFHIDHIRPLSSFDLTDPDQLKAAFHWTNLQPLYPKENMYKRDKLNWNPAEDTL
jgi:hypothetical protein